jgi:hypothetical protein
LHFDSTLKIWNRFPVPLLLYFYISNKIWISALTCYQLSEFKVFEFNLRFKFKFWVYISRLIKTLNFKILKQNCSVVKTWAYSHWTPLFTSSYFPCYSELFASLLRVIYQITRDKNPATQKHQTLHNTITVHHLPISGHLWPSSLAIPYNHNSQQNTSTLKNPEFLLECEFKFLTKPVTAYTHCSDKPVNTQSYHLRSPFHTILRRLIHQPTIYCHTKNLWTRCILEVAAPKYF